MIEPHQHVVPFVRRATYRVTHEDDAVTEIDGTQNRCQHANIGFRTRDHQRVRLALPQMLDKLGLVKVVIAFLVDDSRGRAKRRQRRVSIPIKAAQVTHEWPLTSEGKSAS